MDGENGKRYAEQHEAIAARLDAVEVDVAVLKNRAERGNHRASASETVADDDRHRIDELEARADVDRELIAELQAEGLISTHNAEHLAEALRTSRMIGAATGIVMARRHLSQQSAFAVLRKASMDTNTKLRVVADEVVLSVDESVTQPGASGP